MIRKLNRAAVLGLLAVLAWQAFTAASEKDAVSAKSDEDKQPFLRVRLDEQQQPIALETAIVSYAGKNDSGRDVVVDLVGVVHIGDKAYYRNLNKLFESYDAVLYELVAPKGTKVPKGGGEKKIRHPLTAVQRGMQSVLQLDYQLDHVDYTKPNFVHADMSPDEFSASMKERDESFLKMFFRMLGQSAAMQGHPGTVNDAELLSALFAKNRALTLKRLMARQFEQMELMLTGFNGPDGSTIITERNKKAMSVLKGELGTEKSRIAIFYGAGHLSDMDERMRSRFGMTRGESRWLTAWSMTNELAVKPAREENDGAER